MFRRSHLFLIILATFWGCEEVVELDVPFERQVVVVADIAPNRPVTTTVSYAQPVLSTRRTEYIEDASVFIKKLPEEPFYPLVLEKPDKDTLNPTLPNHPFYYLDESHLQIEAGSTYELRVNVPGIEQIITTTTIPDQASINSISSISFSESPDSRDDNIYNIKTRLDFDHENPDNLYHLMFYFQYLSNMRVVNNDTIYYVATRVPQVEKVETEIQYVKDFQNGILIEGKDLQDGRNNLVLQLSVSYNEMLSSYSPRLVAELRNTNEDYFKYRFALSRQQQQQDSIINQAVVIPSNIENGEGSFGGYSFDEGAVILGN